MLNIYLVRHGKTMFNTIGRAQGWSDTPLTAAGARGIAELGLGFKAAGVRFDRAYSSDSGRTIQTMGLALAYSDNRGIPYRMEPRIREWCFGSFDGGYDGQLFGGILPRVFAERGVDGDMPSYEQIATAILQVDTAHWAEPWEVLRNRIVSGLTDIAQEAVSQGARDIIVVSHGMTIGTFVNLFHPQHLRPHGLDNGSVTHVHYEAGHWSFGEVGDMTYRETGHRLVAADKSLIPDNPSPDSNFAPQI